MPFKYLGFFFILVFSITSSGCRSPYHQDRLAATGGVAGAIAGAAIGEANGNPAAGAVIGTVVGAITGSAIGESMDESEARNQAIIEQQLGHQLAGATSFEDVIAMSQANLGDTVIITHIQNHGVFTHPTAHDLIHLKNSGVSDSVLSALQNPPQPRTPVKTVAAPAPRPIIIRERYHDPYWCHDDFHHRPRHHSSVGFTFH